MYKGLICQGRESEQCCVDFLNTLSGGALGLRRKRRVPGTLVTSLLRQTTHSHTGELVSRVKTSLERRGERKRETLVTSLSRQTTPWHTGPITGWVAKSWVTAITSTNANNANNAKVVRLKCAEKNSISGFLLAVVASFPLLCFPLEGWVELCTLFHEIIFCASLLLYAR